MDSNFKLQIFNNRVRY